MSNLVSVFENKRANGWPKHARGRRAFVIELGRALERPYASDAHFTVYATPNGRRLARGALERVCVEMNAIVFDVDCDAVHGTPAPAPDAWRAGFVDLVGGLGKVHPDPFVYMTRGGARIVYRPDEPIVLCTQADAQEWSRQYAVAVAYLARRFGIVADPACKDWTRFYRLPHATREPGGKPERWPMHGDVSRIGALVIDSTTADVDAVRRTTNAFAPRRELDFEQCTTAGFGLLYHLLRARGAIVRPHTDGAFVVRCPREAAHSTGCTGDGSTLLYPPAHGKTVGAIACLHGHCAGMSVRDWLQLFSDQEREAAQRACITRVAV
jgi:hypothetical protein